ncbi:MAG: OmpP1/FadL family transporter [Candidatus Kryptoniota bacterium]
MKKYLILAIEFFAILFYSLNLYAQFPEDALRLGKNSYGVSAQSAAMGNAMTGLARGFDAVYFNPAGLAQSKQNEFTTGLNFLSYNNNATYFGNGTSISSSQTDLTNLGIVYPFTVVRGSFVIAFGYNRAADFNSALGFNGFNPYSSIIPSLYNSNVNYDIPFNVGLEDTLGNIIVTKQVGQKGTVYQSGGLNNWLAAAAMDIAKDFSLGATINLISGSYQYTREYTETDPLGIYRGRLSDLSGAVGFGSFNLSDQVNQDLSGWNAKIGFMYRAVAFDGYTYARIGVAIQTPSFITVDEKFSDKGTANFLSGTSVSYQPPDGNNRYNVTTPFKFSFGASGGTKQITFAGDLEYVDWTQLQFSNSNLPADFITKLNNQIKQEYRSTLNLRAGVEIALADKVYSELVPLVRLGGAFYPSPYVGDSSDRGEKYVSAGVGFMIQHNIDVDLTYQRGWWNAVHTQYDSYSSTTEKVVNSNVLLGFRYKF